jgi:hypothetical protein
VEYNAKLLGENMISVRANIVFVLENLQGPGLSINVCTKKTNACARHMNEITPNKTIANKFFEDVVKLNYSVKGPTRYYRFMFMQ